MLRPATPLTIIFLVAFVLELLSTLSTPIIHAIPLGSYQGYNFGVFGYCNGNQCSPYQIGYSTGSAIYGHWHNAPLLTMLSRTFLWHQLRRLLPFLFNETLSLFHPHRTSYFSAPDAYMSRLGNCDSLPLAFELAAISTSAAHPHNSYPTHNPLGLPRRHSALRAAHAMGWLDHARSYDPHHRVQRYDLRNAPNSRLSKSAQEAHCRERRHEWRELLQRSQPKSSVGRLANAESR